uniref:hypothetical protein n=1 Tax=Pedobacter schmidteae TaxID=2201271 RepID=UPI000EB43C1A|nr:hypothetical protein [Pedobacter schmidteae]
MSQLEIIEYPITEDIEYLGQLEPFKSNGIPTDSIIFKTLPGLGATFWEIHYKKRHSIIVEPNVPVIEGKKNKHPTILGVYKGVTRKHVKDYLNSDTYPKKIVTTPEGYLSKVRPVIEGHKRFDLFKDFFLLLDECDRLITDVNYRGKIIAPMKDFFQFKGKAMVSATAILPSDPRFALHGFKNVKIVPTYDYKKDLTLVSTNNIVHALKVTLDKCTDQPVFIFLNSTITIYSIIKLLGIQEQSKVFCAEDSVSVLNDLGIQNASTELGDYAQYNFLTSRCFSAVDIDLDYKPDVIMVTDVYSASHSILNPATDVIQISGRFRKPEGSKEKCQMNSLTHITNYNENIVFKNPVEAKSFISSAYSAHELMVKHAEESEEEGAKITFEQGHQNTFITDFVNDEQELEPNMVDNYIREQEVRSYYRGFKYLNDAYADSKYFNVTRRAIMLPIRDEHNMNLAIAKTKVKITEAVANVLKKYTEPTEGMVFRFYDPHTEINKLRDKYPDIVEAFFLIGYDKMETAGFKMHLINALVNKEKIGIARFNPAMVKAIHKEFKNDKEVLEADVLKRLEPIYKRFRFNAKTYANDLTYYFYTKRTTNKDGLKAYPLGRPIIKSI